MPVKTVHAHILTTLDKLGAATGKRVADRWEQKELVRRDIQKMAVEEAARATLIQRQDDVQR